MTDTDELLTYADIVDYLAERYGREVTAATLRHYRSGGWMPEPAVQLGRTPAWRREQIDEWHRQGRGSDG